MYLEKSQMALGLLLHLNNLKKHKDLTLKDGTKVVRIKLLNLIVTIIEFL